MKTNSEMVLITEGNAIIWSLGEEYFISYSQIGNQVNITCQDTTLPHKNPLPEIIITADLEQNPSLLDTLKRWQDRK